ncbi:SWAP/Surp [Corchorus olitorius]|uniref:SWAP/Surp n=1 Tax=Corchorus olitorius TaxID=93759 RepID=A0A1R3KBD0_9ROSI|nr:SWAP/Surp [Corchorus olitorius]
MDLEVVGRHALLFDDDAMASFVNSAAALVDWNSLSIDRYDVRHLLSGPPPPRKRRRHPSSPSLAADDTLESELDRERYLDLPPPSPSRSDQQDEDNDAEPATAHGVYNAVPLTYGNTGESNEKKDTEPPTEKLHQIMARTAMFVSTHGGQSEIVLRVKQGDNPTFGFLMPDHPLHPYFRFLVDNQELLSRNSVGEENKADNALDQAVSVKGGGALSLLGTVYGSGEDEEGATEHTTEVDRKDSVDAGDNINKTSTDATEQKESSVSANKKDESATKHSAPLREKASLIKRNRSITTVKAGSATGLKKESDVSTAEKSRASSLPTISKIELPVVEPPSDLKRVVDKIVEFILKNGRQFEAVLVEQDVKHGRFPFLLPTNLYHPYYLQVLQNAEKPKLPGKGFISQKRDSSSLGADKKAAAARESDSMSVASDIPFDSDRKEKFKMVISKSKKDGQEPSSKATQPEVGVRVDAAAAAAILQAATRGIKKPNLEILSKTSVNGSSLAPSSESGHAPSVGSHLSSQPQSSIPKPGQKGEPSVSGPIANAIAKTAAIAAARITRTQVRSGDLITLHTIAGIDTNIEESVLHLRIDTLGTAISIIAVLMMNKVIRRTTLTVTIIIPDIDGSRISLQILNIGGQDMDMSIMTPLMMSIDTLDVITSIMIAPLRMRIGVLIVVISTVDPLMIVEERDLTPKERWNWRKERFMRNQINQN